MSTEDAETTLVTVHEAWGETDAEIVRALLKAHGIAAMCASFPQSVYPMTVDGLGRIEIKVADADRERAAEIIAARANELD